MWPTCQARELGAQEVSSLKWVVKRSHWVSKQKYKYMYILLKIYNTCVLHYCRYITWSSLCYSIDLQKHFTGRKSCCRTTWHASTSQLPRGVNFRYSTCSRLAYILLKPKIFQEEMRIPTILKGPSLVLFFGSYLHKEDNILNYFLMDKILHQWIGSFSHYLPAGWPLAGWDWEDYYQQ